MNGIDDVFLGFVISYLAGSLPSLKELFKKEDDIPIQKRISSCYEKALEKWSADDGIKQRMAQQMFSDINQLAEIASQSDGSEILALNELVVLWADEMRNDEKCALYLQENEIIKISDKIDRLEAYIKHAEESHHIKRGLKEHKSVDNYIRRYCNSEQSENNYLYYAFNLRQRHCLAEFVTGILETKNNKFILYSSAQTGKTTELKQLCWELQHSGLYLPLMFEVRNNTQLKREHLPDFRFAERKEVIIVIDALDEVNGKKYDNLLEEISGYAYDHPDIKIVLSCRSNYRRENQLKQFCNLYLEELSYDDVKDHINKELGKSNGLIRFITENELADFARNPFFLNVLIYAYRDNCKQLPKNKAEIYRLFIEKSYRNEIKEKNVPQAGRHGFEDSLKLLEKIALALSVMNVQTLTAEELKVCLNDDENDIEESLRYDLIRCEDGRYSFKHNAFREWLVANYFYREGLGKAMLLATHPNGRIKPEWYNIIMLWISMYGKKDVVIIDSILTWLKRTSLELVIFIDKEMVKKDVRDDIFKGLLLEYKSLGIRMSNILAQDYKNLLDFARSEVTVRFVKDELNEAKIGTAYYADLMCLCYFLKWEMVNSESPDLVEELFETLLSKTKEALENSPKHELSFLYFNISFFAQKSYFERIYDVIGSSDHYESVRCMLQLIAEANVSDEYLDYILEKEHLVCNQHEGNTTHVVSRASVYTALEKVRSLDGVKKVLAHTFKKARSFNHDEWNEYNQMMKVILGRVANFIKEGHGELVEALERYFVGAFRNYSLLFDHDKNSQKLLLLIRQCYLDAGCREQGRNQFYANLKMIFSPNYKEIDSGVDVRKTYLTAALWMTCEDVKNDFCQFSVSDSYDIVKAGWYREIPYSDVAEYASNLYAMVFPEPKSIVKSRERQKNSFNDFADYDVFKQVVLEMVSYLKDGMTRKEYRQRLETLENGYNQYAFRFISNVTDRDNRYVVNAIVQKIKNRSVYDAFFMNEIAQLMDYPNPMITITDAMKERCVNCAKINVERMCNGEKSYFFLVAVSFMLNGFFEVDPELLPNLLDYADYSVTKKDSDNIYNSEYTLFEYVTARVDTETIAPLIVKKLQDNISVVNYRLAYHFTKYIVENRIEEGYHVALQYALSRNAWSCNILDMLIQNRILVEDIKTAVEPLSVSDKLYVYETLVRNLGDETWVKPQLEKEYRTCSDYPLTRALKLLTNIGSIDALDYLMFNSGLIKDGDDFHFNYDNPNAISSLCFFIQFCNEKRFDGPYMLTSILESLERIAIKNEDSLNEVKRYLRGLTQKGNQYKFLNRYILAFEDKYYASYSGISDINKVMEMINSQDSNSIVKNKPIKEVSDAVEDVLYVSYNWESDSQQIVDYFCFVLETEKVEYKRDKKDCNYLDNIKEFMNAIRSGKTIVVVFSRSYLKSKYCMYELSGIMEDPAFKDRILPVVTDDTIRQSSFYNELVLFWKKELDEQKKLVDSLNEIDPEKAKPEVEELEEIKAVYDVLPIVSSYLRWTNTENIESLSFTHFKTIIDQIKDRNSVRIKE